MSKKVKNVKVGLPKKWKNVPGTNGFFKVSNKGVLMKFNVKKEDWTPVKYQKTKKGDIKVSARIIQSHSLSEIIAMTWHGYDPLDENTKVVHKDGNKNYNWERNLEVVNITQPTNENI